MLISLCLLPLLFPTQQHTIVRPSPIEPGIEPIRLRPVAPSLPPIAPVSEFDASALPTALSEGQARAVLDAAGVPQTLWDEFLSVWWCESRWSTNAVGDGGQSLGAMQLWRGWFARAGEDEERWADPVVNVRTAYWVYRAYNGWSQWACTP